MSDFASEWTPIDDWLLIKVHKTELRPTSIALVEKRNGQTIVKERGEKENVGVVLAMGPGARNQTTQAVVPIDANIKVGATVLFMGLTRQRPDDLKEEMEREGLWLVSASAVIMVKKPKPAAALVQ